ncbi:hypothetical protein HO133_003797 [Letharia lupina]|uniref:Uncharacterized protein n=1 Tax=Letharia lupina TaxID=560253 RepID=A0A8H6CAL2_9LECA|nr:uncharacterized protein HO133_003797 [Letharia lupina]KAF6219972.1 hypothetical protein HO133_003797 [Letharia lupina]
MPNSTAHPQQPSYTAARSAKPERPQLQSWLNKAETHEQMMVGQKTSRSFVTTMRFLEEMETKIEREFR